MAGRQPRRGPAPFASFDHDAGEERAELRPAPRIDISRASSSSHHDSRDSSPDLALGAPPDALGFREEDALDLRASTEELAFLEGEPRRHARADSQGSEAALLAVARGVRVGSVGSQCSALSRLSAASGASALSGLSRSPSPHKMLLETSFCGPKPIDTDPEACAAAVEERLRARALPADTATTAAITSVVTTPVITVTTVCETARPSSAAPVTVVAVHDAPAPPLTVVPPTVVVSSTVVESSAIEAPMAVAPAVFEEKLLKESHNRRARSRDRRDRPDDKRKCSKDVIRIKLKPDHEYGDDEDDDDDDDSADSPSRGAGPLRPPASLPLAAPPRDSRTPSPAGASRKSSFCSLFRSRETIASPESPAGIRRKRSADGRARSKSRERGSVLALFRGRRASAEPPPQPPAPAPPSPAASATDRLRYYENSRDGIIHIPLHTPPDEDVPPPPSAAAPAPSVAPGLPLTRTVLPDGSIIIPLRSPTEPAPPAEPPPAEPPPSLLTPPPSPPVTPEPPAAPEPAEEPAEEPTTNRRERLVFSTQVGSREQMFVTQFSLTKTPSVTSESSPAFPQEPPPPLSAEATAPLAASLSVESAGHELRADSSASSPSSSAGAGGEEAERRVLVGPQESFEEELPYVPTTLPMERPLALPMVPVRERGGVQVARVARPRGAGGALEAVRAPPLVPPPEGGAGPPLRVSLPRSRAVSAPPRSWVDVEGAAERRQTPRRIQTLPATPPVTYVEPERCRCECHAHPPPPPSP